MHQFNQILLVFLIFNYLFYVYNVTVFQTHQKRASDPMDHNHYTQLGATMWSWELNSEPISTLNCQAISPAPRRKHVMPYLPMTDYPILITTK